MRETNGRCDAERARGLRGATRLQQPGLRGVRQVGQGPGRRPHDHARQTPYECPAPCLGLSFRDRSLVTEQLKDRFPITLSLAVGALRLYLLIGVTIGVLAARRRGTVADKMLVVLDAGVQLAPLLPGRPAELPAPDPQHVGIPRRGVHPVLGQSSGMGLGPVAGVAGHGPVRRDSYTRYSRGAMVEALSEDYVRTAKAKGLSRARGDQARAAVRAGARGRRSSASTSLSCCPAPSSPSRSSTSRASASGDWTPPTSRTSPSSRRRR